ncbi:hypothetical protein AUR04nite_06860 [Glutamicibacter uratoxydans]|uniref:Uncharacterized protein n=1 Tax=Glutamicibacter uratoxydans TaxID=43667 RepID=A0A4Y4DMP9_GLUUR|nr:hypothetical protein [Glutamicibacter uratoxydans]GED05154.1 hypothetical protein AUR04nite_06860 [Glutamicibacter uratoxydans]
MFKRQKHQPKNPEEYPQPVDPTAPSGPVVDPTAPSGPPIDPTSPNPYEPNVEPEHRD